jgi:hypothetical protein
MQVKTVGLDLAKDVFQVHGVTAAYNGPRIRPRVFRWSECPGAEAGVCGECRGAMKRCRQLAYVPRGP